MGLGDLLGKTLVKSTVLTEYQADTKQMRFELSRMSKDEQKRHRALIRQTEEQNYAIDKANKAAIAGDNAKRESLAKFGVALGAAAVAYKVLTAAQDVYAKNSQLELATVGVNLDGLRKASQGLVDDTRLLQFAASGMNGEFKLTQQEMEASLRGVIAFRNEGNQLTKSLDNVEKALKEGTVEPLKELGHVIKGVENDTKEGLNAALKDLSDTARKAGPDLRRPGDAMAASSVEMANSVDALMDSLGKLAQNLSPVIAQIAKMVGYMAELVDYSNWFNNDGWKMGPRLSEEDKKTLANVWLGETKELDPSKFVDNMGRGSQPTRGGGGFGFRMGEVRPGFEFDASNDNLARGPYFDPHVQGRARGKGGAPGPRRDVLDGLDLGSLGVVNGLNGLASGAKDYLGGLADKSMANWETNAAIREEDRLKYIAEIEAASARLAEIRQGEDSLMSSLFGTPSEIDAQTLALQGLASTFDGFTGAFGAGIDALITGSSSFADAFKNAIGESLRAMAVEMSISALKHTAYGLASIAFMDGRGAAAHFAAAGGFAAGALAAGGGARLLGAGQSQGATAPRTAGSAGVGTSGGASNDNGGGGSTQVFIVGNDFAGLPARQRESQWRQISRSAGVSIEGDVVLDG